MPKPRVLVVFGGASTEHGVSCLTASGVLAALDRDRYDVALAGITTEGDWIRADEATVRAYRVTSAGLPTLDPDGPAALLYRDGATVLLATLDHGQLLDPVTVDVALALLHGPFGEDGTIQGLFEMLGLRYVGAGVLASAACMDKVTMNRVLAAAGLPVGPFAAIEDVDWRADEAACLQACAGLKYPLFVKPARGGSSVGITRVETPADLPAAIVTARRYDPKVIVEEGLVGIREVECGVLVDRRVGGPVASLPGEILVNTPTRFYDFTQKYLPEAAVDLVVPAPLTEAQRAEVQRLAVAAAVALDVEGLARVDTFVTADGVVVNEVNTMPGFTATSLFPRMWEATGVAYPELIGRLLDEALARPLGLR
ncbi:MAG: D-alanine--D-alanine ligase [Propionibacteriaceae bacterium]|jgi:D-alanine-D-alanine ligase|nr:D-alanine--D-alanine ligase [Propionibacteriaceae bacterium]